MRQSYTGINISTVNRFKCKQQDINQPRKSPFQYQFATNIKPGFFRNQSMKLLHIYLTTNGCQICELTHMPLNTGFLNVSLNPRGHTLSQTEAS